MTLAPGTRLGPYDIVSALGAGGMGEVYRGTDSRLGRDVAIKVVAGRLVDDPGALARFQREARVVASLSHPNIVALHDIGTEGPVAFAVMELLDGEPLDRAIGPAGLPWTRALDIAAAIADGLAYAHDRGVVHRDLKPPNVFITRDGLVKVLDFGLARQDANLAVAQTTREAVPEETQPGVVLGTVGYMSPEQVRGEAADARSDIFSLGCVLFELLSGRRPFGGATAPEVQAAILRDQPGPPVDASRVPPAVNAIVQRCLEKRPEQRFQSARDLAFALRQARAGFEALTVERAAPQRVTRRTVIALGSAVIAAAATGLYWYAGRIRSLAVLPLEDRSPDRHEEFFADVMTAELASHLARMGNWRITASTSVMQYRGPVKNVPEIARELGVDAVVVGTVQRDGARLKVTVQVIDGGNGSLIWGDSFEREVQDLFALQNRISFAVAREVGFALAPEVNERLTAAARPVPQAAFDEYVRGRHALSKRSEADLRDAVRLFQAARDISESTYAAAWTGLADAYGQLGYGSYDSPRDSFPLAHAAATMALELDDTLSAAHASLGYALMYYDWKFSEAESQFRRAIDLNPSNAVAHEWLAYLFTAQERSASDAEGEIARAKELDPLSVAIRTDQAFMYHYYRRNDDALRAVREAIEMDPRNPNPLAWFWRGRILTSERHYEEAHAAFQKTAQLSTWTPAMAALGFLYGKMGRRTEAANLLGQFDALTKSGRYASSFAIAVIHAGLGDSGRALSALEAAYRERSHWLVWLKRDPRWDDLRDDQRFKRLVRDVGLPA